GAVGAGGPFGGADQNKSHRQSGYQTTGRISVTVRPFDPGVTFEPGQSRVGVAARDKSVVGIAVTIVQLDICILVVPVLALYAELLPHHIRRADALQNGRLLLHGSGIVVAAATLVAAGNVRPGGLGLSVLISP